MRRVARETVYKLLFEYSFLQEENDITKELMMVGSDLNDDDKSYIENTYKGTIEKVEELNSIIAQNIKGYTLDRLVRSDLVVLELGVYEIQKGEEPVAVVINEAVTLAKKYGTDKSGAFVNGVLGKIANIK